MHTPIPNRAVASTSSHDITNVTGSIPSLFNDQHAPAAVQARLAQQSPEEREVYLAILQETRKMKELELQIAEERRREKEAQLALLRTHNNQQSGGPQSQQQAAQGVAAASVNSNSPSYSSASISSSYTISTPTLSLGSMDGFDHSVAGSGYSAMSGSMYQPDSQSSSQFTSASLDTPQYRYDDATQIYDGLSNGRSSGSSSFAGGMMPSSSNSLPPVSGWDPSGVMASATPMALPGSANHQHHSMHSGAYPHHQHHFPSSYRLSSADNFMNSALIGSPKRESPSDLPAGFDGSGNVPHPYSQRSSSGDSSHYEQPSPPQAMYSVMSGVSGINHPSPPYLHQNQHYQPSLASSGLQNGQQRSSPTDTPSPHVYAPPSLPGPSQPGRGMSNTFSSTIAPTTTPSSSSKKVKKLLVDRSVSCSKCSTPMCKLLLRGTSDELAQECDLYYECPRCAPQHGANMGGAGGMRPVKKRTRQTEDLSVPTVCDVCIKTIGRGGLIPKLRGLPVGFAVEVVCNSCSARYNRCSDCGGGSGRVGVGKWRAKELFENGRKTCRLPHVRLGSGELEISTWELPMEIQNRKELPSLLTHIKTLWSERVLARLAIPEVLECEEDGTPDPAGQEKQQRTFADIEDLITKGWPARESLLKSQPSPGFRRYFGISWAKTRGRRDRASGKTTDSSMSNDPNNETLMENVKKTTVLVPQASTLVGMWLVDWNIAARTILLSTSAPFETADAEDKQVVGVGEVLTRLMEDHGRYNAMNPTAQIPPPQHLFVATRSITPAGNSRLNDTLTRRRGFLSLEEYLRIHPGVDRAAFSIIPDGHTWIDEPSWKVEHTEPEILVRWLGTDIDMAKLEDIKEMEYGKKSREVAIAKGRRITTTYGNGAPSQQPAQPASAYGNGFGMGR